MSNANLFCMYDKKSGEHFGICTWPNENLYKRSLVAEINDTNPRNLLASHSSDFELYALGQFDLKSGEIIGCRTFICNASDLKEDK